jgi:hypothetical protein
MSKFIEVVKTNKGTIIKKGLVVVGTLVGLAIVNALRGGKDQDEEDESVFGDETEGNDEGDSQED